MKRGWKILSAVFALGVFLPMLYSLRLTGTEPNPFQSDPRLKAMLVSQGSTQQSFFNQFFTELTLTVDKEGDGLLPGTFRTVLLQAAGIRHNNPFSLVKIHFEVQRVRVSKGNLPALQEGLITIDCAGKVVIDGSLFDPRYLNEGETPAGITLQSSGNTLKGCQIVGFGGHAVVVAGNRNQILQNKIGNELTGRPNAAATAGANPAEEGLSNLGSGLFVAEYASENLIDSNQIFGNKQDGITFSPQAGPGNRIAGNIFQDNLKKGINGGENQNRSIKPVLKPINQVGDGFIISGTLAEMSEVEIYLAAGNGKEGLMTIVPPFSSGKGDFSVSVKSKGFIPGESKIVALATSSGRNTSEFSDPAVIPLAEARPIEVALPPPPPTPPARDLSITDIKETNSPEEKNEAKPLNEKASSALSVGAPPPFQNHTIGSPPPPSSPPAVDPFLNATTLPLPSSPPNGSSTIQPPSNTGSKSGEADSVRVESVSDGNGSGAP